MNEKNQLHGYNEGIDPKEWMSWEIKNKKSLLSAIYIKNRPSVILATSYMRPYAPAKQVNVNNLWN